MKKVENNTNVKELTANEFTNVKDIKGMFLYTKDGYILSYLHIPYYNIDLLPREEKAAKTNLLTANMRSDHKSFTYMTFPREINLDDYKMDLKNRYRSELSDIGMKHILEILIKEAIELSSSGENYEHQHYIKLWKQLTGNKTDCEKALQQRTEEFMTVYRAAGIAVEIIKEQEIIKLCNLFGNAIQAPYETMANTAYETTLKLV